MIYSAHCIANLTNESINSLVLLLLYSNRCIYKVKKLKIIIYYNQNVNFY